MWGSREESVMWKDLGRNKSYTIHYNITLLSRIGKLILQRSSKNIKYRSKKV